jgi:hypothetical protein
MTDFKFIRFERSGGVTGLTLSCTVDMSSLKQDEAEYIRNLLSKSDLTGELPGHISGKQHPDQLNYKLTVEKGGQKQVFLMHASEVPEKLWPLIRYLTVKARNKGDGMILR